MSLQVPSWSTTELDVMRIGLAFVAVKSFMGIQFFRPNGELSHPVGIARLIDLTWMGFHSAARLIQHGALVAALCYAADVFVTPALLFLTSAIIAEVSFRSSFGSVNHGHHLLAMVLTAQTASSVLWTAATTWNWNVDAFLAGSREATGAWWALQAIVAVYFTSGLSKLTNTQGVWILRSPMILLSAYARADTDRMMGDKGWGESGSSAARVSWLLDRPTITRGVFATGLFVELATPIGLLGEPVLLLTGVALIALHQGNRLLLGLPFPEYQLLVLVYLVNVPQLLR